MMIKCKTNNIFDDVEIQEVVKDRSSILADHHRMYEDVEILLSVVNLLILSWDKYEKTGNVSELVSLGVNVALLRDFSKKVDKNKLYEYFAKAVEEYKQYMEENEKADTECAKGFLISADEEEQIRQSEEYKQYMEEHKEDK